VTGHSAPSHLSCRVEHQAHAVVVSATGAIDLANQATFAEAVQDALNQETRPVVIDLTGVTFLGSPGLAALVQAHENAMRLHRDLRIAIGNQIVRRSIELTGLAKILPLVPDLRTAMDSEQDDS
jgi:anti-sigma B factor antagonist